MWRLKKKHQPSSPSCTSTRGGLSLRSADSGAKGLACAIPHALAEEEEEQEEEREHMGTESRERKEIGRERKSRQRGQRERQRQTEGLFEACSTDVDCCHCLVVSRPWL